MTYFVCHHPLTDEPISIVWKHDGLFSFIPLDPMNTDYQTYLSWVEEGNTAPVWKPEEHDLPFATPDGN
jgi:hypothetical protein